MATAPRFLIIDGYTRSARDELAAGGASLAAHLYDRMLRQCGPPGTECDILFPSDAEAELPAGAAVEQYDGVAWTGCSLCINDPTDEVARQVAFARLAFERGVPSFGSCWAAQIAIAAAGGTVQANPHGREMGIARKIRLTAAGRGHPMYVGKTDVFDAFSSHDDEVTHLPPGAVSLAGNRWTEVQAVSVVHRGGTFWGLQYHPEYDLHELARLTFCRIDKLIRHGFFRDREQALAYVDQLETLHHDHSRKDLAWQLGIDSDVLNDDVRLLEVRNWIWQLVLPSMGR